MRRIVSSGVIDRQYWYWWDSLRLLFECSARAQFSIRLEGVSVRYDLSDPAERERQLLELIERLKSVREAARLNTIRLDVMELTEKVDNAIKFLSDMFYARLYGLAAAKVGVPDYRRLVDQKLRTAGELYRFMVDQFNQTRSFVLELLVVIILIIDLVFLFRGK